MKLADWLTRNNVKRSDFARRIGVSPGAVTQICKGEGAWVSRETAEQILAQTRGAVTPNDFLALAPTSNQGNEMSHIVTQAVEAFARGEIVVVTDDDDRENEGDLIVAASLCTPEKMAFIIRNCCGIVCVPLTARDAQRLNLNPMVAMNDAPLGTAFTVSVDTRHGLTTGISAEQRSNTVRALANGNMGANDFVRPGHVFPLIAKDGGVLMRSGHTEAAIDLCKLAGVAPVAVICELANDDGTVMVGPQIADFAAKHNLKRISVADLIAYRQSREKLVERVARFPGQDADRRTLRLCLSHAIRLGPAFRFRAWPGRRRAGRAGKAASRRHSRRHIRRRRHSRAPCNASRTRDAASWSICATVRLACPPISPAPSRPVRKARASINGARSALARRSSGISTSPRSACAPTARANMSACPASASRSRRWKGSIPDRLARRG